MNFWGRRRGYAGTFGRLGGGISDLLGEWREGIPDLLEA